MKLDALDHPKTLDFASRLGVSRPTAIGHLELLWAWTGKYAVQGDVGKHADGAIARGCDWMGPPEEFIGALREAGFIDPSVMHRLVVHDWPEHAPRWVRSKLKTLCVGFISAESQDVSPSVSGDVSTDVSPPSKGSEGKSSEEKPQERRAPSSPATRIPEDFDLTQERRAVALRESLDPDRTFAKFSNYWRSASGAKARKHDWDATWRNWCMTETDRGGKSGIRPRAKTVAELEAEEVARACAGSH